MTVYDNYRYAIERRRTAQEALQAVDEQYQAILKERKRLKADVEMFALLEHVALTKLPENQVCTS